MRLKIPGADFVEPTHKITSGAEAFILALRWADLSEEVRHAAKRHLLDTIGVMVAGAQGTVATQSAKALAEIRGTGEFSIPGMRSGADLLDAIFLSATSGHGIELDDGYRQGSIHPGTVVVPALLQLAQQGKISGVAVLEAMVAGYETVLAIARAAHPDLRIRGFHPTGAVGVFGAMAATAKLRKLTSSQLSNAFGIAASGASGLFAFLAGGGDIKRLHAGHAAREGAFSVFLAEQGVEGPPNVLEGRDGFFQAFAADEKSSSKVELPPAVPYAITDCYVKPYACCRHLQPAIEALITILAQENLKAHDIQSINVETYRIAAEHADVGWDNFATAQLSFRFTMAIAAKYNWIELKHFEPEVRADPQIAALSKLIHISAPAEIDQLYPKLRPARVTVITTTNRRIVHQADEALGSNLVPFDDTRLQAKFLALVSPALGSARAKTLLNDIWEIESNKDVSFLMKSLAL